MSTKQPPHRQAPKPGTKAQIRRFAGFLREEVGKLQMGGPAPLTEWELFVREHPELLRLGVRHAAEVVLARRLEWRPPLKTPGESGAYPVDHETVLYDIGGIISPEPRRGAVCLGVWRAPCPLRSAVWNGVLDSFQPGFMVDGKVCPIVQRGDRMLVVIEGPEDAPEEFIELKPAT